MNRATTDFKSLADKILKDTLQGLGGDQYAVGTNKVLMMNGISSVLEKAKGYARESRDKSAAVIKR